MSFKPGYAIPPGDTLKEIMEEKKWTVEFVAEYLQKDSKFIAEFLEGKQEVDEELSLNLQKLTGVSHQFWLNLEKNYRDTLNRLRS